MKSWKDFSQEEPELADLGKRMLLQGGAYVGLGFLATLRKDGAPRLHPVSLVFSEDHLFVFIPTKSPKCSDLKRDGRYALQAFPPAENEAGAEFYISGVTQHIEEPSTRQGIIAQTGIYAEGNEQLFELFLDRAMHTILLDRDTPTEHPFHRIWRSS
ncbi:MAG TPA: pyridoxamine 5'-phosphate oxidase family protein [Anaerolineales bacterium]|nr:pyridoxamine 5'-phosphate oxidase family protein [Anaerolineales bacterium]